jgi:hypothetical protein
MRLLMVVVHVCLLGDWPWLAGGVNPWLPSRRCWWCSGTACKYVYVYANGVSKMKMESEGHGHAMCDEARIVLSIQSSITSSSSTI